MNHIKLQYIDPYIIKFGELGVTYYSLSYVIGVIFGWQFGQYIIRRSSLKITEDQYSDFMTYFIISIVIGGRLGYVLFYDPIKYLSDPLQILMTYKGGMSFHGALIGAIIGMVIFCKKYKLEFFELADLVSISAPAGIFLGRLANFINGELYGRYSEVRWAMIFPSDIHQLPRHPSQLYEAIFEGLILFAIMCYVGIFKKNINIKFRMSGCFLLGYSIARFICEFFREPDIQIGFIVNSVTMGQILSIPMAIVGLLLIFLSINSINYCKTNKYK